MLDTLNDESKSFGCLKYGEAAKKIVIVKPTVGQCFPDDSFFLGGGGGGGVRG